MTNGTASSSPAYWDDARQPWTSLCFLLPWLVVYEVVMWTPAEECGELLRNGADIWIRTRLMQVPGLERWLPLLIVAALLGWHLTSRQSWWIHPKVLFGMLAESTVWALLLIVAGQWIHRLLPAATTALALCDVADHGIAESVGYLGAGIYEEFLFRLLLLPAVYGLGRLVRLRRHLAMILSTVLTTGLFAVAHYVPTVEDLLSVAALHEALMQVAADPETWFGFAFRVAAGLAFATLFWLRGFGVTVGSHAIYDVLVGVVLAPLA